MQPGNLQACIMHYGKACANDNQALSGVPLGSVWMWGQYALAMERDIRMASSHLPPQQAPIPLPVSEEEIDAAGNILEKTILTMMENNRRPEHQTPLGSPTPDPIWLLHVRLNLKDYTEAPPPTSIPATFAGINLATRSDRHAFGLLGPFHHGLDLPAYTGVDQPWDHVRDSLESLRSRIEKSCRAITGQRKSRNPGLSRRLDCTGAGRVCVDDWIYLLDHQRLERRIHILDRLERYYQRDNQQMFRMTKGRLSASMLPISSMIYTIDGIDAENWHAHHAELVDDRRLMVGEGWPNVAVMQMENGAQVVYKNHIDVTQGYGWLPMGLEAAPGRFCSQIHLVPGFSFEFSNDQESPEAQQDGEEVRSRVEALTLVSDEAKDILANPMEYGTGYMRITGNPAAHAVILFAEPICLGKFLQNADTPWIVDLFKEAPNAIIAIARMLSGVEPYELWAIGPNLESQRGHVWMRILIMALEELPLWAKLISARQMLLELIEKFPLLHLFYEDPDPAIHQLLLEIGFVKPGAGPVGLYGLADRAHSQLTWIYHSPAAKVHQHIPFGGSRHAAPARPAFRGPAPPPQNPAHRASQTVPSAPAASYAPWRDPEYLARCSMVSTAEVLLVEELYALGCQPPGNYGCCLEELGVDPETFR